MDWTSAQTGQTAHRLTGLAHRLAGRLTTGPPRKLVRPAHGLTGLADRLVGRLTDTYTDLMFGIIVTDGEGFMSNGIKYGGKNERLAK